MREYRAEPVALIMYPGNIHNYVWLYMEWGKVMPEMGLNWD